MGASGCQDREGLRPGARARWAEGQGGEGGDGARERGGDGAMVHMSWVVGRKDLVANDTSVLQP